LDQVNEFKKYSLDIVKISIAQKKFPLACLFLNIYKNSGEKSADLQGLLWNLNFETFSEDLAFIALAQSLFPGVTFF
jgi:hypothetical protein